MQNLLTWHFWFNLRPEPLLPIFVNIFLGFLILLLLASIFTGIKQSRKGLYKIFWKKAYNFSIGNLIIGAVFFFFNYERAAFLSARFWLAIWIISMLWWLWPIVKQYRLVPAKQKQLAQEQEFKKYSP
ncbi:MAG: hypothetical protein PHG95_04325, partial [Patescibacteria group bacterium]|nr:hypothetical protein [Patescibacteria group bacterium]